MERLADLVDCRVDEIAAHDLMAYIPQPGALFGLDHQFLAASRLDNLSSVYAGLVALTAAQPAAGVIPVLACFDHEEVGSQTRCGAGGSFLADVLSRIKLGHSLDGDQVYQVRARSQVVSADVAHSIHPNYTGLYDLDQPAILGGGPVLKLNAAQHYSTDAPGAAMWRDICRRADLACQSFVSNNSVSCGSTIGPMLAAQLGMPVVDVGIPILSMHSAREMCSVKDIEWFAQALECFFAN
jgi:aspartyl aminopeptidase